MYKVILPTSNRWLNQYFNTEEAYRCNDLTKLRKHELDTILEKSMGELNEYIIEFEDRTNGQYFIVENDTEIKWILISADFTLEEGDGGSTNTYFVQYVPMALRDSYEKKTSKKKKIELFLKGTSHLRATTETQIMYYRMAKTIGIEILNSNELNRVGQNIQKEINEKFKTIEEWKSQRAHTQNRNSSNKSSYLLEEDDSYIFYGKTFGANGRESIFILYMLAEIAKLENKKIYLYEVNDNGTSAIESSMKEEDRRFKSMLENIGIIYYIDAVDYVENEEKEKILNEADKDSRHQAEFMRNLMIKFNAKRDTNGDICRNSKGNPIIVDTLKKCYLCECTIQKAIIASHIQRVTDINKLNIPYDEKRKKAVDADNGFWLCANHDKLFEYGIIIFDENDGTLKMDLKNLDYSQREFIIEITKKTNVSIEHFTNKLKEYLKIHNDRIKNLNKENKYDRCECFSSLSNEYNVAEEHQGYKLE